MRETIIVVILLVPLANALNYGIHCDSLDLIQEYGIDEFVERCYEKGYDIILINVMPWQYYFESPTLQKLGWSYGGDLLNPLIQKAHAKGIKVYADIQTLAWKVREGYENPGAAPSKEDVISVVRELIGYGVDGISEEMFLADWMKDVYKICKENNVIYIHKHIPWDVYWLNEDKGNLFDCYSSCNILMTEDYYMNDDLLRWQMARGFSNSLKRELWIKSCPEEWALGSIINMENVLALRVMQYNPNYVFAMIYNKEDFEEFEPKNIEKLISNFSYKKEIFNVIVYLTNDYEDLDSWQLFEISYPAIANAAEASGYEVYITNEPLENASVYYIFTRGKIETTLHLPNSILKLFQQGKPVFLQIAGELPNEAEWNIIREKLGINDEEFYLYFGEGKAVKATYNGIEYNHLSQSWFLFNGIKEEDVFGKILSKGKFFGEEFVFMVRNKDYTFINGGGLHAEASFPISNLINDALQFPCKCVCNVGKTSVFYAYDDCYLKTKIPYYADKIEYMVRKINGEFEEGTFYGNEIEYKMEAGDLLIAKVIEENISISILKPRNHLYINDREIMELGKTIVIGKITIELEVKNVESIEIYFNDELKYAGNETKWVFDEFAMGKYEIKAVGYRKSKSCYDTIEAYIFNI